MIFFQQESYYFILKKEIKILREEVIKLKEVNLKGRITNKNYRTEITNANSGIEEYKEAVKKNYNEERDKMIEDFKRIKKELFNKIAENEITIKTLTKKISEDNGNILINQQQRQVDSPSEDVLVINPMEAESENENVRVTVRLNLLKNG
jgi:hypothetical protein